MYFYQLAILAHNTPPLCYSSQEPCERGDIVLVSLANRRVSALVLEECCEPEFKTKSIIEKIAQLSPLQLQLAQFISEYYACCMGLSAGLFAYKAASESKRSSAVFCKSELLPPVLLSSQQQRALELICAPEDSYIQPPNLPNEQKSDALQNISQNPRETAQNLETDVENPREIVQNLETDVENPRETAQNLETELKNPRKIKNHSTLLFADTGSGKTEIYIHAIARALERGKQALFLMPEISLTPQMCERIGRHFAFGLWHSKITKTAKEQVLKALADGQIQLILGARSALFLPWTNLGLIIVDEEHDSSYKSSRYPCINARDLALFAGSKSGAKVILGSATPSMASFYNENLKRIRLKGSYFGGQKSIIYSDSSELISEELLNELFKSKDNFKSSIIFLPVRANFRQVVCKDCAAVAMCPRCSVALSLHGKLYKCHYCNYKQAFTNRCGNCSSTMLEGRKMGTAQLEMELKKASAERGYELQIARLDSDEASSPSKLKQILNDFSSGKIDVLIGTQMIAKGHDYHNVDFVGILGLDSLLYYPEFAAREQTLALAIQVAGRAGRAGHARVMIATKFREFFEQYLNDYESFLQDEKRLRVFYPPFKRLLRILIEHKEQAYAQKLCDELVKHLAASKVNEDDYELVGFGPCPMEKIGNKFRFNILLRSSKKMLLSRLAAHYKMLQNVTIDIDPLSFS